MIILSGSKIIENIAFPKQAIIFFKECDTIVFNNCTFNYVAMLGNVKRLTFSRCTGNILYSTIATTEITMDNQGECVGRLRFRDTKIKELQKLTVCNKAELYYDAKYSDLDIATEFTVENASFTLGDGVLKCPTIFLEKGASVNFEGEKRDVKTEVLADFILYDGDTIDQSTAL